jgi:hypothetical protein
MSDAKLNKALWAWDNLTPERKEKFLQQIRSQGPIILQPIKDLPSGTSFVSEQTAQLREQKAFDLGADSALKSVQEVELAIHTVALWSCVLVAACSCQPGPATHKTMKTALSDFVGAMQFLSTTMKERHSDSLIVVEWNDIQPSVAYWSEMRTKVDDYLATPDEPALVKLRQFLQENDLVVKKLNIQLAEHKKRGAALSKTNAYIGKLAAEYAEPQRGEWWTVGVDIYERIKRIPEKDRADDHRGLILRLNEYFKGENIDRARLGPFISRVRKEYLNRNPLPDLK